MPKTDQEEDLSDGKTANGMLWKGVLCSKRSRSQMYICSVGVSSAKVD